MSSTELVTTNYTPEQLRLITDVVAKGASKDELELFLYRCKNLGLDPLKPGQIYFVKYGSSPGTIVIGIEGFRARAARTGKLAGIKRGALKGDKNNLVGAWAEVYRSDWKEPAREEVPLAEYDTKKAMWLKMPETMLKKVAEAAALRMAFPDDLGGVYVREEMEQAETQPLKLVPSQPGPEDGVEPNEYLIPFGKFKGRSLEQVGPSELAGYVNYIEERAAKDGKPVQGMVADFIDRASGYIAAFENGANEQEPVELNEPAPTF